jgi:pentatricopeptide repeat protein
MLMTPLAAASAPRQPSKPPREEERKENKYSAREAPVPLLVHWISAAGKERNWRRALNLLREHWDGLGPGKIPNARTINATLTALGRAGRMKEGMELFEEAVSQGMRPDNYTFGAIMLACSRARSSVHAWDTIDLMRASHVQPNLVILMSLMGAVTADPSSTGDDAIKVLSFMTDSATLPSVNALNAALQKCAKGGEWELALLTIKSCEERWGVTPDARSLSAVLHACDVAGEWREALQVLGKAKTGRWPLNVTAFNCVISALAHASQWREALLVLGSMQSCGISPDIVSFNTCITACANAGEWRTALDLMKACTAAGVNPTAWTYNAAMCACAAAQPPRWKEARRLFDEIEALGWDDSRQAVISYNTLFVALGRGCRVEDALLYFERMKASPHRPNVRTYTAMVQACAHVFPSRPRLALNLIEEMTRAGIQPNEHTYSSAITAAGKARDVEAPRKILRSMRAHGIAPNDVCFLSTLSALERLGAPPQYLLDVWKEMSKDGMRRRAGDMYAVIALQRLGRWEQAVALLDESDDDRIKYHQLRQALMTLNGASGTDITLEAARAALAAAAVGGHADRALSILRSMSTPPDAVCFGSVLEAHCVAGQYKMGLDIMNEMISVGCSPDAATYAAAIRCCRGAGDWDRAILLREQALKDGILPTKRMLDDLEVCIMERGKAASSSPTL